MNIALAIILEKNKVLIAKIKPEKVNEYGGLEYVFPCESIQDVSNIEGELIKEVKKQTNLDISVIRKIGERIHPNTQNQEPRRKQRGMKQRPMGVTPRG